MKKFTFQVPSKYDHLFVEFSEKGPSYYSDKDLKNPIFVTSKTTDIDTLIPDNLSRIEISKATGAMFINYAVNAIDYFHLWPFDHMIEAEIIVDGTSEYTFSLLNNKLKSYFKSQMEDILWTKSLFIVYTRKDHSKIGFLLLKTKEIDNKSDNSDEFFDNLK